MKTSAVGVREGRQRRSSRVGFTDGPRVASAVQSEVLLAHRSPSQRLGLASAQGHVPMFSLIAHRAHCKRPITAIPGQASTSHLCADGRGKGARCSANTSRPPVPTVKF